MKNSDARSSKLSWFDSRYMAVIQFDSQTLRGILFERRGVQWSVLRSDIQEIGDSRAQAWKKMVKSLNFDRTATLYVGGAAPEGVFFRFDSTALGSTADRKASLEMELPRRLLKLPQDYRYQFCESAPEPDGSVKVNTYVFSGSVFTALADAFSGCGRRADGFIYPLMAVKDGDPAVTIPELEPEYSFLGNSWCRLTAEKQEAARLEWLDYFHDRLNLPDKFDTAKFLGPLLIFRLVTSTRFHAARNGLRVLPDAMRPVRYRRQIQLAVVLLIALVANLLWSAAASWDENSADYRSVIKETREMRKRTDELKAKLRKSAKVIKEQNKLLETNCGQHDVLGELADISRTLAPDAMILNYHRGEREIDFVLLSDAQNPDVPEMFKPLEAKWKIAQIQQRQQQNQSSASYDMKLAPAGQEKKRGRK